MAVKPRIVSSACPRCPILFKVVNVAHATPPAAITVGMFIHIYRMVHFYSLTILPHFL